ncbi:MAG: M20 family metallopeptidase [Rhodovarius sp.]|nr:M20 family metallopeptidase [Rhodovarius sp.]MDW8314454.1 M20 family metallopeptidase [Rhodovarius sp.]
MIEIGSSERLLEELRGWVEMETPSTDAAAVNRLLDHAEAELRRVGAVIERLPGRDGYGDTLIARSTARADKPAVVVAGHVDTVWDHGRLTSDMPFRIEGDRAYGPGIYDMKAGSFLAFHALREILRQGVPTNRPIVLLLTPDEEVGSPTSRAPIEAEAARAAAVLIPEPAGGPQGACVTARKGTGDFTITIRGRAAHAGGNWSEGRSATVALARVILAVHGLTDLDRGITTNVAPVWGGTRPNVIADEAGCKVDFRIADPAQAPEVEAAIRALAGEEDGISITVEGGLNRPPMAETPEGLALYARAREIAARFGYDLPKQHRGGGSDGNFTAALGIPTLDGLGCPGHGAHAPDEHILWRQLAPRGATLAELMRTL